MVILQVVGVPHGPCSHTTVALALRRISWWWWWSPWRWDNAGAWGDHHTWHNIASGVHALHIRKVIPFLRGQR